MTQRVDRTPRSPTASRLLILTFVALAGCTGSESRPSKQETTGAETLRIRGSDTMLILAQKWGEAFHAANPDVDVEVEGGGSGRGIAALLNDATDLANASRPMREREKVLLMQGRSKTAREFPVALDALTVFVHPENPVAALTLGQLRGIYSGEISNWRELGGPDMAIDVYNRDEASGTYAYFQDHVLDGAAYRDDAKVIADTAAIIAAVKNNPRGVGYGGIAYVERGVNAVSIAREHVAEAIDPTPAHAMTGLYPLARILYVYTAGEPSGPAASYLDFVRSASGEKVVEEVGYYPLPEDLPEPPAREVAGGDETDDATEGELASDEDEAGATTAAAGVPGAH